MPVPSDDNPTPNMGGSFKARHVNTTRVREAASQAESLFPGPLGLYIARDLRDRADSGSTLMLTPHIFKVVEQINTMYSEKFLHATKNDRQDGVSKSGTVRVDN